MGRFSFCIIVFIFILTSSLVGADSGIGKNTVSLEYAPVLATFAAHGGGLGIGYERRLSDFISLQGILMGGGIPAENEGLIAFAGLSANAVLSPLRSQRSFKVILGGGLTYIGALREKMQEGLEAHFFIPALHGSVGWRFILGKRDVRFTIQPELTMALMLPGPTGSGIGDNLEWYSTGYVMAMIYPNVSIGVSF